MAIVDWNASSQRLFMHRMEQEGVFDLKYLYRMMKEWFKDNNYTYIEKENTTNIRDKGAEIKLCMIGERKVTDYFKFEIEVRFLIIRTQQVKVKNKPMYQGDLKAHIKATLHIDYRNMWAKNKFSKTLRYIYNNFLIKNKIENVYQPALKFEGDDLFNVMKECLGMYNQ